jgi:dipeptidyl aminopeptidase/acylaminoacyl peptidase
MSESIERYLNVRSATSPSFSPDGKRLAFISNLTGIPQPWTVPAHGGWPQPVSLANERTGRVAYAPRAPLIAFDRDRGGNERWQIFLADESGYDVREYTHAPETVHLFGRWSHKGDAFSYAANVQQRHRFDVYVRALAHESPVLVYQGSESSSPAVWSPDDRFLVVREAARPEMADLYLVDLQTKERKHLTPHEGDAYYFALDFSQDGGQLYLLTDQGREFIGLATLDLRTLQLSYLDTPEWDIEDATLSPNRRWIAYSINGEGASRLIVRDLRAGVAAELPGLPLGVASGLTWSPDGRYLAFAFNGPRWNGNVWTYDRRAGRLRQVTQAPCVGLRQDDLVEPQLIRYRSFDGLEVPVWLYAPHGAHPDRSNPVLVQVHGGPASQARPTFDPVVQYFVHRGYVVAVPNVRGSTGYGRTYAHLDDVRKRMDSVKDLQALNEWLRTSGWAHPKRIAVMGGSYGGFMVLAALTNYPEHWAAGVDLYGVADFIMHLERTEPWGRRQREIEYGTIERDGEFLRAISPIHHVEKIRAPLMVIHGANDPRVSISLAESLVARLREREVPVEYLRFEDEGHGLVRLPNRLRAYPAIADFLDRHVREAT